MSAIRIVIFDDAGRSLYGIDAHHGADHAAQWVLDTFALLAQRRGITRAIAVEFDPDAGGNAAVDQVSVGPDLRLELRRTPAGTTEVVGMWRAARAMRAGRTVETLSPNGRGWRVVHSTIDAQPSVVARFAGHDTPLQQRAARWRGLHPHAAFLHTTGGAQ